MFRVPTRSLLRSFWLAGSLTVAVLIGIGLWALGLHRLGLGALAAGVVSSAVGLAWPGLARRPYEAWTRLSRKARRAARLWLTGVVFVVVWVVGFLGGRIAWKRPALAGSGWTPKPRPPIGSYDGDSSIDQRADSAIGWTPRFGEWAWRSGNAWAWSLIPLLALLRRVEGESAGGLGGNVYTLY